VVSVERLRFDVKYHIIYTGGNMQKIEVGPFLKAESATWTKSDWEHYRLVSMAMKLEAQKIDIGWLVKTARKQLGYSQRQLAKLSHVQQAEISKIEKQKGNPTLNTLNKVFIVLGIETEYRLPVADNDSAVVEANQHSAS
jgi:DNA-binding XRE family transcriptional regulator